MWAEVSAKILQSFSTSSVWNVAVGGGRKRDQSQGLLAGRQAGELTEVTLLLSQYRQSRYMEAFYTCKELLLELLNPFC